MSKRKLYCECGGLIKTKSKQTVRSPKSYMNFFKASMYHMTNYESKNYYVCSKCGKKHY